MGVDFNNSSMSYPAYDRLVTDIANCYKGKSNIQIPHNLDLNNVSYWFGYHEYGDNEKIKEKYIFDDKVPCVIKKFCNNPYGNLTKMDVLQLYICLTTNANKINNSTFPA
jgi:hypothetical protein